MTLLAYHHFLNGLKDGAVIYCIDETRDSVLRIWLSKTIFIRFIAERPPWAGMSAAEIKTEIIDGGRSLLIVSSRPVGDPFNMLLQYGLNIRIPERRLSLEQMRDILSEHILVRIFVIFAWLFL